MTPPPLLDTNVVLRHALNDHVDHSPRATAFLKRIEDGELRVYCPDTTIVEAVFTMDRTYRMPKGLIRSIIVPIIDLRGVMLTRKRRWRRVLDLYVEANMSFGDASQVETMEHRKITEIVSFDKGYDRVPGITRIEP